MSGEALDKYRGFMVGSMHAVTQLIHVYIEHEFDAFPSLPLQ